jgi:purine-binding chemotaxis protein CheW
MGTEQELLQADDDDDDQDLQAHKYLTFALADEQYGIKIVHVVEIIGMQRVTPVPEVPAYIRGVINLRGKVIPVVDMRLRFGLPARDYDDRTCIIVVSDHGATLGLVVDTVSEVDYIPESDISPPIELNEKATRRYVTGLGKVGAQVKILLDAEKMLHDI